MLRQTGKSLQGLVAAHVRAFSGKTELGKKYKTATLRMRTITPVYPPPGMNLKAPAGTILL